MSREGGAVTLKFEKAVILGATGPTGIALAEALRGHVSAIRVVSRSEDNLRRVFANDGLERFAADVLEPEATRRAIDGCDVVFDCIGLPSAMMHGHPDSARNIAAAVRKTEARAVQISSYWSYLPITRLPLDESHPRIGGSAWIGFRRDAEDILQEAGSTILQLPDFYGPYVHTSTLQKALEDAVSGRSMNWIGGADVEHEFVYVPDAMRIAVRVATHEDARGQLFLLPGAGTLTGNGLSALVSRVLGTKAPVRAAPPWLLRLLSIFNPELRGFMQMVPHYASAISYDATKLRRLLGTIETTSYANGVSETLQWMKRANAKRG